MKHPYQCLAKCRTDGSVSQDVLVAACGSEIFVHDIESGKLLFKWPLENPKDVEDTTKDSTPEIITLATNGDERPRKRRKTVMPNSNEGSFTKFVTTKDGHHLVATTAGEEKSVVVFHIGENGQLEMMSERHMLKRPCAIALTPEDDCILVGDKFGDVYSLPLHPSEGETPATDKNGTSNTKPDPQYFKPSATNLTVHSGRNLRALQTQMQRMQAEIKQKETMEFEHELLLGHVSMLTDITTATVQITNVNASKGKSTNRSYIITADRDEHIRVSRGRPQAWIIENYCFGHTQFVSKLCIPHPNILVSGGGDDQLFVWDWRNGTLLGTLNLQEAVSKYWESQPVRMRRSKKDIVQKANDEASILQDSREAEGTAEAGHDPEELQAEDSVDDHVAVSGLWANNEVNEEETEISTIGIFCSCEGIPAIFNFNISTLAEPFMLEEIKLQVIPLAGNPLDVVLQPRKMFVAIDNIHEPASIDGVRKTEIVTRLQVFDLTSIASQETIPSSENSNLEEALNATDGSKIPAENAEIKHLRDLLYGVEILRKRGNEEL